MPAEIDRYQDQRNIEAADVTLTPQYTPDDGWQTVQVGGSGGGTPSLAEVLDEGNDADGNRISGLGEPDASSDAATKQYVDNSVGDGSNWPSDLQGMESGDFTAEVGKIYQLTGESRTVTLPSASPGEIIGIFTPTVGEPIEVVAGSNKINGTLDPYVLPGIARHYVLFQFANVGFEDDEWFVILDEQPTLGPQASAVALGCLPSGTAVTDGRFDIQIFANTTEPDYGFVDGDNYGRVILFPGTYLIVYDSYYQPNDDASVQVGCVIDGEGNVNAPMTQPGELFDLSPTDITHNLYVATVHLEKGQTVTIRTSLSSGGDPPLYDSGTQFLLAYMIEPDQTGGIYTFFDGQPYWISVTTGYGLTSYNLLQPQYAVISGSLSLSGVGSLISAPVEFQVPMTPFEFETGQFDYQNMWPALTYAPGTIASLTDVSAFNVDSRGDAYDLNMTIVVMNQDGSESISLSGGVILSNESQFDQGTINPGDLSVGSQNGSDLAYDNSNGNISTAAGGTYSVSLFLRGSWD